MLSAILLQTQSAPNPNGTLFMFGGIALIFYFLIWRPQRKQQKEHEAMVEALEKGDQVITMGGIIGTIVHLKEDRLTIKSSDTRLEIDRGKVGRVIKAE